MRTAEQRIGNAGRTKWRRSRHRRRGAAAIYACVAIAALCAFASLSVDLGRVFAAKSDLQTAADAAARAAAQALPNGGPSAARAAAQAAAQANTCDGQPVTMNPATDVTFVNWDASARSGTTLSGAAETNANAVAVALARTAAGGNPVTLLFGRVIGKGTCDVTARSTACIAGSNSMYAIIGINSLTITGNGFTDSYNSSNGPYSAATALHHGSIASNGDISLAGSSKIDGDVRPGVGKKASLTGAASATGMVAPLAKPLSFPSVKLPASYIDAGDCKMSSGTIHLPGGNYLFGTIDLSGSAHITWDGPVNLYIRDDYSISGNVVIDTYQDIPANRILYFLPTCKTATWNGNHSCVGELYAPDTDFTIGGGAQLFGRITAKTIRLSSSGGLHYDEALPPIGGDTNPRAIMRVK